MKSTIEATIEYLKNDCNSDYAEVAIEALEKQIPKKPAKNKCCCQVCGDTWNQNEYGSGMLYCWNCGQKIDWSEVEE